MTEKRLPTGEELLDIIIRLILIEAFVIMQIVIIGIILKCFGVI